MKKIINNFGNPKGFLGFIIVYFMNLVHIPFSRWCFSYIKLKEDSNVVDLGCGGGKNVQKFLKLCPKGRVVGIDFSKSSVETSVKLNKKDILSGRCEILNQDVSDFYVDFKADLISAFDTIYFWQNPKKVLENAYKHLSDSATILIANEEADGSFIKNIDNANFYDEDYIKKLLLEIGFKNLFIEKNKKKSG